MYRRKIEVFLNKWKSMADRKPLVIKGCRQCGKTSSVKAFARLNYDNIIYMDFMKRRSCAHCLPVRWM